MMPTVYVASDYATIEAGSFRAYYGYEQVDEHTEEWCGVVWKNGKEVARYTNSRLLNIAGGEDPENMLLATLALYLGK